MRVYQYSLIPVILLGVALAACTRPQGDGSPISLTIPLGQSLGQNLNSQSATNLNYVAINVSGPNMDRIFCSLDLEDNRQQGCVFKQNINPTTLVLESVSVELMSPNGEDRLIQVLMAYSSATNGSSMTFKYGEASSKISSEISVSLTPEDIGGGAQTGGRLMGRYMNTNFPSGGPTDLLRVAITPKEGRPPMDMQLTEMYSGWFQAFSLENIPVDYILKSSGLSIFGEPMNKTKLVAKASNSSGAMAVDPVAIGGGEYEAWGFFGTAAATASKTTTVGACGAGTQFTSCLSKDSKFIGPFRTDSTGKMLTVTAGSPNKIAWQLLPGVDSTVMEGVSVFSVAADLSDANLQSVVMSRGFNCLNFRDKIGATLIGDVAVTANPQEVSTGATFHIPNPKRPLAICPRRNGELQTAALVSPKLDNDGGCSDCKYFRFELSSPAVSTGNDYTVAENSCVPATVKVYKGMGISTDVTEATSFQWTTPSWGTIHTTSNCVSGDVTNPTVNFAALSGSNWNSYYLKITGTASADNLITATAYSGEQPQITFSPQYNKVDIVTPVLALEAPSHLLQNTCYQGRVAAYLSSLLMPSFATPQPIAVNSDSTISFFSSAALCATNVSGTNGTLAGYQLFASNPGDVIYFRNSSASAATISASGTGFVTANKTFGVATGAAQTSKFKFAVQESLEVGKCSAVDLMVYNGDNFEVPVTETTVVQLSTSTFGQGAFYSSGYCNSELGGGTGPEAVLNAGESRFRFYFRPYAATGGLVFIGEDGNGVTTPTPATPPAVTVPGATTSYATIAAPNLPSTVLGSHNFPIPMTVSTNMTDIKCYRAMSTPSWGDTTNCNGQFDPATKVFSWDYSYASSDLSTNWIYYFGNQTAYNRGQGLFFQPRTFFKTRLTIPGSSQTEAIQVVNCDVVLMADGSPFSTIQTAINSNNTVCLKPGTGATFSSDGSALSLPADKSLIGHVNIATGQPTVTLQGLANNHVITIASGSAQTSMVSNFIINKPASTGSATAAIQMASTNNTQTFRSSNNRYQVSSGATTAPGIGIYSGGARVQSFQDSFQVVTLGGDNVYGVKLAGGSSEHQLYFPSFNLSSGTTAFGIGLAGDISGSLPLTTRMLGAKFAGSGLAMKALADTVSYPAEFHCSACAFDMQPSSYLGTAFGVSGAMPNFVQYNYAQIHLNDSKIVNAENSPMFLFLGTQHSVATVTHLKKSVVNQNVNQPVFNLVSGGLTPRLEIKANHFFASVGNPLLIANTVSSGQISVEVPGASSAGVGGNVFCGTGSANKWAAGLTSNSILVTGTSFSAPATILETTMPAGSLTLCKGVH